LPSCRPLYLAARLLCRPGRLGAWHDRVHREHVVGVALGRMSLASKHAAHELMVAGAIFCAAGLEPNLGRELVSAEGARELHGVERLLLVGHRGERLYGGVAEPVAGR